MDYDIYKMVLLENGEIIFNALWLSGKAKVIGKIQLDGQPSIIDQTLDTEIIELERIR